MRASRLISIVLTLQTHGSVTAVALAGELGVSVRTIYRDLIALQAAGVPVYGESGHGGGYRLVDGYRTRLTGLTTQEATSLMLMGLPEAAEALGRHGETDTARLKMLAALPEAMAQAALRSANLFHFDSTPWYERPESTPFLPILAGAVWEGRMVAVVYRRWQAPEIISRELAPLGLVLKGTTWYLVAARCGPEGVDLGAARTFRVSEFLEALPLEQTFAHPSTFNLARHWRASTQRFERELLGGLIATVRADDRGLNSITAHPLPALGDAARTAVRCDDGRWEIRLPVESIPHAVPLLIGLGPGVEVVEPKDLRAALTAQLEDLLAPYRPV